MCGGLGLIQASEIGSIRFLWVPKPSFIIFLVESRLVRPIHFPSQSICIHLSVPFVDGALSVPIKKGGKHYENLRVTQNLRSRCGHKRITESGQKESVAANVRSISVPSEAPKSIRTVATG
jgi:hypothetical protein